MASDTPQNHAVGKTRSVTDARISERETSTSQSGAVRAPRLRFLTTLGIVGRFGCMFSSCFGDPILSVSFCCSGALFLVPGRAALFVLGCVGRKRRGEKRREEKRREEKNREEKRCLGPVSGHELHLMRLSQP